MVGFKGVNPSAYGPVELEVSSTLPRARWIDMLLRSLCTVLWQFEFAIVPYLTFVQR